MRTRCSTLACLGLLMACNGGSEAVDDGARTGPCYDNGTCNAGLRCVSDVCVDDDTSDGGDAPGDGSSSNGTPAAPAPQPECWSAELTNAYGSEKLNAAFCFGFAYDNDFTCTHDSVADLTFCDDGSVGYYVTWTETSNGTRGDVADLGSDDFLGNLRQDARGAFVIDFADGERGVCSVVGDVLTLCLE